MGLVPSRTACVLARVGMHRARLLAQLRAAWYSRTVVQMLGRCSLQVWVAHSLAALAKGVQSARSASAGSTQNCVHCWLAVVLHGVAGCMVDCWLT